MTHEAGIWIFGIIALVCLSVWILCRRSKAVAGRIGKKPYGNPKPFHYEPMTQDAINKMWSDLADKMPLAPVQPYPISKVVSKPLPKGWQGWEGGECPVPDDTDVVVMKRSGRIWTALSADCLRWYHYGDDNDIVAWRVA